MKRGYFENTLIDIEKHGYSYCLEVTTSGAVYARSRGGGTMRACDVLKMRHVTAICGPDGEQFTLKCYAKTGWHLKMHSVGKEIPVSQS